jgi:hypothetical protein
VDRAKAEVKAFNGHVLCADCVVMERGVMILRQAVLSDGVHGHAPFMNTTAAKLE